MLVRARRRRCGGSALWCVLGGSLARGTVAGRSVFVGAHNRQDARGDGGIGGVRRAELGVAVVVVKFKKVPDAAFVHRVRRADRCRR